MTRFVNYGVAVLFGVSGFVLAAVGVKPIFADLLILSAYYLLLAGSWNLLAAPLLLLFVIFTALGVGTLLSALTVAVVHELVDRLEQLKGKTLLISPAGYTVQWPWLKAKYMLKEEQKRPYTFNIQPFIADRNVVQQGYLSSEPYAIEKEAKFKPTTFLLSDYGWPPYSTTIVCMEKTLRERPKAVAAFVKASMQGWKDYLKGDARAANALIKKDNPAMTDDRIAVGIRLLNESGMVFGGDAAKLGVGIVTDERMKATYDMLVAMKLLDPAKVELKRTYTTQFVKDLKILP